MLEQVKSFLRNRKLLIVSQPVLVGVSGGPDSVCLLHVLCGLGYPVIAAHLNHQLRDASTQDEARVAALAAEFDIPFVAASKNVRVFAAKNHHSLEEAARILRYQFLFEQAKIFGAQAVAVGHTADDQVETVLMHFLRGAGLPGLKGMLPQTIVPEWSQHIPVVRPLLHTWRDEVLAYCQVHNLQPIFDESNLDKSFYRNRLRHELLPELETYNPQVRKSIWRMAQVLSADYEVFAELEENAFQICLADVGGSYLALWSGSFAALSLSLQRRVLRRAVWRLHPALRDIHFDNIETALALLGRRTGLGQCDLGAGLRMVVEGDRFWVAREGAALPLDVWPQLPGDQEYGLDVPGCLQLANGWKLAASRCAPPQPGEAESAAPRRVWLDARAAAFPLRVRPRLAGERFRPLGMHGQSVKLSDFMINVKLPQRARARWPLVCAGDEIVWVVGRRLGEAFRLQTAVQEAVCLELLPPTGRD